MSLSGESLRGLLYAKRRSTYDLRARHPCDWRALENRAQLGETGLRW